MSAAHDLDTFVSTPLGDQCIIFDFERDFAGELKCMPMIARLKLDRCGVKLSLKQWNKFSLTQRRALAEGRCDTVEEIDDYGARIVSFIEAQGDKASRFQVDLNPAWEGSETLPVQIATFAEETGLERPTREDWSCLSPLQRFVLIKLTRPGHENTNLREALREFGLRA